MEIDSLQHYRIRGTLGKGAMGEVYQAEDTRLRRMVALKILPPQFAADPRRLGRFRREAEAIAQLNHPAIVTIYSIEEANGLHFITMEKVEGETLGALIDRGALPLDQVLKIGADIAGALHAAHEKGVVHRDLKPSNIMITRDGRVKVLDFGLAKLEIEVLGGADESMATLTMTEAGAVVGTVPYMSPEQLESKTVDARTDIFALGVILYEMSTGQRPFQAESRAGLISSILRDPPLAPNQVREDMPRHLARVISHCLEKDPERRAQSALDIRNQLESLETEATLETAVWSSWTTPGGRRSRRRRWPIFAGAAAAIVLLVGLAAIRWLPAGRTAPPGTVGEGAVAPGPGAGEPELLPLRVMVVPFENRTGDPALETVSLMTADWLTQGLSQTGRLEVVPLELALTAKRFVAESSGTGGMDLAAMARETRAATVVSGSYYRQGDQLILNSALTDVVEGRILSAVPPLRAPLDDPVAVLDDLRQRIMTEVAVALDPSLGDYGVLINRPPSYEAYEAYAEGMQSFVRLDFPGAIASFLRAGELEPRFATPRLLAATAFLNMRQFERSAELVEELQTLRDSLAPLDRLHVDWLDATLRGDQEISLQLARQAAELAPASTWVQTYGVVALRSNRAAEALHALAPLDPDRGFLRGWGVHFHWLTMAHHLLGQHERELEAAREGRRLYPDSGLVLVNVARVLAALGRTDQLKAVLDESAVLPPGQFAEGSAHSVAASELAVHGEPKEARRVAAAGIDWHRVRPPEEAGTPFYQWDLGRLLVMTERWDELEALVGLMTAARPGQVESLGFAGLLAAARGDETGVASALGALDTQAGPYQFGGDHYWRAVVHAWAGERAAALDALRQAIAAGWPFAAPRHPHSDPVWQPLRGDAGFEEIIRPAG